MIDVLLRQFGFHRKHLFCQPVLQRQIVGVGAQEGHCGMGVCIFEAGQNKVAAEVALGIPVNFGRLRLTDVDNLIVFNPDFAPDRLHVTCHGENAGVIQSGVHFHFLPSSDRDCAARFFSNTARRLSVYGARQMPYSVTMPEIRLWSVTSKAGL